MTFETVDRGAVSNRPPPSVKRSRSGCSARADALLGDLAPAFVRSVLDSSPDCIKLVELDGTLSFMNENGQCAMDVDNFDLLAGAKWPDLWPEKDRETVVKSLAAAADGKFTRFEAYCPTAKGRPRWWDVSVAPIIGSDGRPERIVSISRDISDRVRQEKRVEKHERELEELVLAQARTLEEKEHLLGEKTLLMQEVDHRVKNSLAMITSLLHIQERTVTDTAARDALARASARVQTIASVHERLYRNGAVGHLNLTEYLNALGRDLNSSVGSDDIVIETQVEELDEATAENAVTIGLTVTELVTNAARHAVPEDCGCTITVGCRMLPGGKHELTVTDDGCGLPDDFDPRRSRGLGMRIVESGLRRLGGELSFGPGAESGTIFTVRF